MPAKTFKSAKEFQAWLAKNQDPPEGIWLRHFKKDSGKPSVTYQEALEEALCQGWIDAQKKSYDSASWIQRYLPRRPKSSLGSVSFNVLNFFAALIRTSRYSFLVEN